jgi:hypothetical protein
MSGLGGLRGIDAAFRVCVGELGMWSAARLFVESSWREAGADGLDEVRAALGEEYPMVEELAIRVLGGRVGIAIPDPRPVAERLHGCRKVVFVGMEAHALGPLLDALVASAEVAILLDPTFPFDRDRVNAGWGSRCRILELSDLQALAGAHSAIVAPVYGADDYSATVSRLWPRLHGPDVRLMFRELIGWSILTNAMQIYPRWLVQTDRADFTHFIAAEGP